jgi:hypothetical protein
VNEQRKGEIALTIQRYRLERGRPTHYFDPGTDFPSEMKRLIEDVANGTGISKRELLEYATSLINEREGLDDFGPKHDPQEDDPKLGPIIREAAERAKQKVYKKYGLKENEHRMGIGHEIWTEQKKILKGKGINWKSPREMNPNTIFD